VWFCLYGHLPPTNPKRHTHWWHCY